jgi:hypothetical protein
MAGTSAGGDRGFAVLVALLCSLIIVIWLVPARQRPAAGTTGAPQPVAPASGPARAPAAGEPVAPALSAPGAAPAEERATPPGRAGHRVPPPEALAAPAATEALAERPSSRAPSRLAAPAAGGELSAQGSVEPGPGRAATRTARRAGGSGPGGGGGVAVFQVGGPAGAGTSAPDDQAADGEPEAPAPDDAPEDPPAADPAPGPVPTPLLKLRTTLRESPEGRPRLDVRVLLEHGRDVASVPYHLLFDPDVLRLLGARQGRFLAAGGVDTAFFVAPTSAAGRLAVGQARLGGAKGVDGHGEVGRFEFDVIGPGEPAVWLERAAVVDSRGRSTRIVRHRGP